MDDAPVLNKRVVSAPDGSDDEPLTQTELRTLGENSNIAHEADDTRSAKYSSLDLKYKIDDVPPWYLCIALGFQHYLTMFGATASIPLILAPALCLTQGSVAVSEILSTVFFVSGFVTILQTTLGIRLPIIQGGTFSFLVPAFSILALPKWKCPSEVGEGFNNSTSNMTSSTNETLDDDDIWQSRMRELQGAIIVASFFQVFVGISGVMGFIMRYIGPLTIAPTIALIGLSLFDAASASCSTQWGIAALTIVLITVFSQYFRNLDVPVFTLSTKSTGDAKKRRCIKTNYPIFKMFPVILAILFVWLLCFILTVTDALPTGNAARTDVNSDVLSQAKWFRIPYPFQWGLPTFNWAGTLGMLAGVVAGMLESIGDYYACARMSAAPPPPIHAINRGILVEGLGCILSGMWGTGTGTTSYSENIGAIGITKVGSRRVIQTAGIIMMLLGVFGKFGALFVTIPTPIIGGVFMTMFGMISAVGISNLQYVNLNSSRNLFIFGFSLFFGISVSKWLTANPGIIQTGVDILDQVITVLLSTSMFLGGLVAFILDNSVPGSLEERGIIKWRQQLVEEVSAEDEMKQSKCYEIPFISKSIRKHKWTRYVAVCPTYNNYECNCCKRRKKSNETENGACVV